MIPDHFPGPLPPAIPGAPTIEPIAPPVASSLHQSAFRPVLRTGHSVNESGQIGQDTTPEPPADKDDDSDDEVDIETTEDDGNAPLNSLQSINSASNSALSNHSGQSTSPQCWSPPRESVSVFFPVIDVVEGINAYQ